MNKIPSLQELMILRPNVEYFQSIFSKTFPLLNVLKSTPQDMIWHAEGDVHIHTDMVLDETYKLIQNEASHLSNIDKRILILSALVHDIAKPITTKESERDGKIRIVSPKHEIRGMSYLAHKLGEFNLTAYEIRTILGLVGYHQSPKMLVIKDKNKWEYHALSRVVNMELVYWLEIADMRGRTCSDTKEQLEYLELFKLYSQEYMCWNGPNWQIHENPYINAKGFKDLQSGSIFMAEEATAKYYDKCKSYSHLVVMCGLSGVGKTTYINDHYSNYVKISLDDIRERLGNRSNQDNASEVLTIAKAELKVALAKKYNIIYDATNIRKDFRTKVTALGNNYHALTEIVYLNDTLSNTIKKDSEREHKVGQTVIEYQNDRFEYPQLDECDLLTEIWI